MEGTNLENAREGEFLCFVASVVFNDGANCRYTGNFVFANGEKIREYKDTSSAT